MRCDKNTRVPFIGIRSPVWSYEVNKSSLVVMISLTKVELLVRQFFEESNNVFIDDVQRF